MSPQGQNHAHLLIDEGGRLYVIIDGKRYIVIQRPADCSSFEENDSLVMKKIETGRAMLYSDMGIERAIFENDVEDALDSKGDCLDGELLDVAWFI